MQFLQTHGLYDYYLLGLQTNFELAQDQYD